MPVRNCNYCTAFTAFLMYCPWSFLQARQLRTTYIFNNRCSYSTTCCATPVPPSNHIATLSKHTPWSSTGTGTGECRQVHSGVPVASFPWFWHYLVHVSIPNLTNKVADFFIFHYILNAIVACGTMVRSMLHASKSVLLLEGALEEWFALCVMNMICLSCTYKYRTAPSTVPREVDPVSCLRLKSNYLLSSIFTTQ